MWLLLPVLLAADPPAEKYSEPELTAEDRSFWSFVPPVRPAVPEVNQKDRVRNPIDAFILAKLEGKGISPSAEADKRILIRRVTFDLTGLPPTPAEVDSFLKDTSPDAYEKVVDRLLASTHFGERWAQHWLDVVRFAETNGYELDAERPHAWRYRDYVIKSFNADKPYDQFLKEQIAGDELAAGKDPKEAADLLIATGMHRCGQVHVVSGNLDKAEVRQEVLTETVVGIGSGVLGLTLGCARCHDHKFDPLSQADFYRLQAYFSGTKFADVDLATEAEKAAVKGKVAAIEAKTGPIKKQIAAIDAPYRARVLKEKTAKLDAESRAAVETPAEKRTEDQKKRVKELGGALTVRWDDVLAILTPEDAKKRAGLREQLFELNKQLPLPAAQAWALTLDPKPAPTFVLKRGDFRRKATEVSAAVPRVANPAEVAPKTRTEFAAWLADPKNPLTARVIVNRLWAHHFGRGIVNTPNDFGTRGGRPSHPELLDWLATELIEQKWSLKALHRLMVTSATYRQASDGPKNPSDPDNTLLGHMNRRRLEAEAIRDAILVTAGTLNAKPYGPGVKVPLEPEVYDLIFTEDEPDGLWPVTPDPAEHTRRSVYLFAKRNMKLPLFEAFDQPDTLNSCAARPVSTFAPQALILMNGPFAREQAGWMAFDLLKTDANPARVIGDAYRRTFGREPTAEEAKLGATFLAEQAKSVRNRIRARQDIGLPAGLPTGVDPAVARALADYCLALLNSNEFVYID
jgi:hypothetical protein